jgi:hypothetical protein
MDPTVYWDDEPGQNVEHVAEHGLTPDEVDAVLLADTIWDELNDDPRIIYPVTAYEVPEPS